MRSVGGTRGGYKWQQEARANENWPEKAAGYYNTKRNGTESNEATGKKQSQSNQINANISLKNYESKIERAGGSWKEWVMKGGEGREGGERRGKTGADNFALTFWHIVYILFEYY